MMLFRRMPHIMNAILVSACLSVSSVAAQSASSEDCPESQFQDFGMNGVVTSGDANNIRAEPSTSAELVGRVFPGETFNVNYNSAQCADGYLWVELNTINQTGWTVERAVDDEELFIELYEPTPRAVGTPLEDGSIRVEEPGVTFTIPAGLDITSVTTQPVVGFYPVGTMSAQPYSARFTFEDASGEQRGEIAVYPFQLTEETAGYWDDEYEILLTEQPSLAEYIAQNSAPQSPQGGSVALFGGAPIYLPFASGNGLRYITYFAQDSVEFTDDLTYTVVFRGLSEDQSFLVTGEFPVSIPASAIPAIDDIYTDLYPEYLRQLEVNLAALPTSAFTPDLALLDALFATITITNNEELLELMS